MRIPTLLYRQNSRGDQCGVTGGGSGRCCSAMCPAHKFAAGVFCATKEITEKAAAAPSLLPPAKGPSSAVISTAGRFATGDRLRRWRGSRPRDAHQSRERHAQGGPWRCEVRAAHLRFAGVSRPRAMARTTLPSTRSGRKMSSISASTDASWNRRRRKLL